MPTIATLLLFGGTALAMLVVPGPSVVYVVARSIEHGRAAGLYSMLGLESGALLHILGAAFGLAALLATSEAMFAVVRCSGAGYLLYLGVRQLCGRDFAAPGAGPTGHTVAASRMRLFRDGVLVDLLNPKTALFFIAFLPQFVDPARGPASAQILVLGLCFVALAAVCDGCYAVAAGRLAARVRASARVQHRLNKATGCVYVGLAGLAAFA